MGLLAKIGLGSEPSLEEQNKRREIRQSFLDFLASEQGRALKSQTDNKLTPESTQTILSRVKKAQEWLRNNPNANLSEIQTERDAFTVDIKRVYDVNDIKKLLNNIPLVLENVNIQLNTEENNRRLTKEDLAKLKTIPSVSESLVSWNKTNQNETLITYQQKLEEINRQIIFPSSWINTIISSVIESAKNDTQDNLQKNIKKTALRKEKYDRTKVTTGSVVSQTLATTTQVTISLGIVTLCLFCGSLAANQAIGRDNIYRVIYFIWGAFPLFAPLIAFYSIMKRFREGPIPMYSVLPLTTTPAETHLGKLLRYPFFWTPDAQSDAMRTAYLKSLASVASY